MVQLNKKGFSLVELLAVVAILGILMGTAIIAYSRYLEYSTNKAIDIFNNSIVSATEDYIMDHPNVTSVTVEELIEDNYLEKPSNARITRGNNYKGNVTISKNSNLGITTYDYTLNICLGDQYYTYDSVTKKKTTDTTCKAE